MKMYIEITATQYIPVEIPDVDEKMHTRQISIRNFDQWVQQNKERVLQEREAGANEYRVDVVSAPDDVEAYFEFDGKELKLK